MSQPVSTSEANPVTRTAPSSPGGWSGGKILLVGIIALLGLGMILAALAFSGVVSSTQALFKVNTTFKSAVASSIGSLKREQKLVVLSVPVTIMMHKVAEKSLGGIVPLGTTEMMMVVDDNRVQYIVPLQNIKEDDFVFNASTKTVTFYAPQPEMDIDMISVQSDPTKIHVMTNTGWLDGKSSEKLREIAQRELRETVIGEGNRPFLQDQARSSAELNLRKLLTPLVRTLEDGVELKIEFKK